MDWCDANAYCAGVGKRLCGKIGGGGNAYGDDANAAASQWFAVCSSGGQNGFTYGNTLQPQPCNGGDNTLSGGPMAVCCLSPRSTGAMLRLPDTRESTT